MNTAPRTGLILRIDAKRCHVEIDGNIHLLPLRGKLFEGSSTEKRPIAVGDRVEVTLGDRDEDGAIEAVLPRRSRLGRRAAGESQREQVLAANVSLVLVVAALREPPLQPLLVDRILAAAEREEIPAAVVFTKVDRDRKGELDRWLRLYAELGYPVFATSVVGSHRTGDALAALAALLQRNVTVLCGLSGVGKSSLLNALAPGLDLAVGSLGRIRQGRHTTTHTRLIPFPGGGHVLDTPGIRAFGLWSVNAQEVAFYFREIRKHSPGCEFRTCTHRHEPGCAVRAAVAAGEIDPSRMQSYLAIVADAEADRES